MTIPDLEWAMILAGLLFALFCCLSGLRNRLAAEAERKFIYNFSVLCDDERVPLDVIENAYVIFADSRPTSLRAELKLMLFRIRRHLRSPDAPEKFAETSKLPAFSRATTKAFIDLYIGLILYLSYSVPIVGAVERVVFRRKLWLARKVGKQDVSFILDLCGVPNSWSL